MGSTYQAIKGFLDGAVSDYDGSGLTRHESRTCPTLERALRESRRSRIEQASEQELGCSVSRCDAAAPLVANKRHACRRDTRIAITMSVTSSSSALSDYFSRPRCHLVLEMGPIWRREALPGADARPLCLLSRTDWETNTESWRYQYTLTLCLLYR